MYEIEVQDPVPGDYAGKREGYHLIKFRALSPEGEEMARLTIAYIPSSFDELHKIPESIRDFAVDRPYVSYTDPKAL